MNLRFLDLPLGRFDATLAFKMSLSNSIDHQVHVLLESHKSLITNCLKCLKTLLKVLHHFFVNWGRIGQKGIGVLSLERTFPELLSIVRFSVLPIIPRVVKIINITKNRYASVHGIWDLRLWIQLLRILKKHQDKYRKFNKSIEQLWH